MRLGEPRPATTAVRIPATRSPVMPLSTSIARGLAQPGHDAIELASDPQAGDRGIGNERQAFPRAIIDHAEDAETPAARSRPRAARSAPGCPGPACARRAAEP